MLCLSLLLFSRQCSSYSLGTGCKGGFMRMWIRAIVARTVIPRPGPRVTSTIRKDTPVASTSRITVNSRQNTLFEWRAGRSSEVERSLMVLWVVGSILHGVDPLSYFSFQPVLHDWCNKGRGMCYPGCGMVHIKEPLLLIDKSSLCGGSGFPFSLSEWSLTICLTPYNRRWNVLSASLNKPFLSLSLLFEWQRKRLVNAVTSVEK